MKKRIIVGEVVFIVVAYLLLWPIPVEPIAWQAPHDKGFVGEFAQNEDLLPLTLIPIEGDYGPEDIAVDSHGRIAVSLHSGMIAKLNTERTKLEPWVDTKGRPLGIEYDQFDNLLVADAYLGLLSITPTGEISVLANTANDAVIRYADDVDVSNRTGKIYFSDASTRFGAQESGGTLEGSLLDLMEHSLSGRVIEYNPETKFARTILDGLSFANGIAMSHDQKSILINETGNYRVLRYWVEGEKQGKLEVLIDNLPGFPDNIAKAGSGGYWLGLASPRSPALDKLSDSPEIRKVVQRLPSFMRPKAQAYGHIVKINEQGDVIESLQDPSGLYPVTTGAIEVDNILVVSSLTSNVLAIKNRN
jgi:sugar lactone lactonase YvrE